MTSRITLLWGLRRASESQHQQFRTLPNIQALRGVNSENCSALTSSDNDFDRMAYTLASCHQTPLHGEVERTRKPASPEMAESLDSRTLGLTFWGGTHWKTALNTSEPLKPQTPSLKLQRLHPALDGDTRQVMPGWPKHNIPLARQVAERLAQTGYPEEYNTVCQIITRPTSRAVATTGASTHSLSYSRGFSQSGSQVTISSSPTKSFSYYLAFGLVCTRLQHAAVPAHRRLSAAG